jgi:putative ABC transport system substrate-binding protein
LSWFGPQLEAKRVELLKDVKPRLVEVAYLLNPDNIGTQAALEAVKTAAAAMNVGLQPFPVRAPSELEAAFAHGARPDRICRECGLGRRHQRGADHRD